MRKYLFASTCLLAVASPLLAETKIETKLVQPVRTATVKAGAADDVLITAAGSVVTTGPAAVIVDSNHKLTNQGTIQITNVSNAVAVDVGANLGGGIVNSGKIIVDETFAAVDDDKDGDLDGPFALGGNRFGIRTNGAFTGNIVNSGGILVEGNDSAGISLGGPLTGNLVHDGTTTVVGDRSVGVSFRQCDGQCPARRHDQRGRRGIGRRPLERRHRRRAGRPGRHRLERLPLYHRPHRSFEARCRRFAAGRHRRCRSKAMSPRASSSPLPPRTWSRPTPTRTRTGSRTARKARPRSSPTAPLRPCGSAPPGATSPSGRSRPPPPASG